jgi:hypothetical protein
VTAEDVRKLASELLVTTKRTVGTLAPAAAASADREGA